MNEERNILVKHTSFSDPTGNASQINLRTLSEAQLQQTLDAHQKWVLSKGKGGKIADLRFTDLEGAALDHKVLSYAKLQGDHLIGANLSGSKLVGAHLEQANLSSTRLKEATLKGASLKDATIKDASSLKKTRETMG